MKKIFLLVLAVDAFIASGQCVPEEFCNSCIRKLGQAKFNFLKSFKVDGEGGNLTKVEYSYVLTKGSKYMISICAQGQHPEKILFTLYNSARNKVATNEINNTHVNDFIFECNATGIYYLRYSFEEAAISCGGIALGFTR